MIKTMNSKRTKKATKQMTWHGRTEIPTLIWGGGYTNQDSCGCLKPKPGVTETSNTWKQNMTKTSETSLNFHVHNPHTIGNIYITLKNVLLVILCEQNVYKGKCMILNLSLFAAYTRHFPLFSPGCFDSAQQDPCWMHCFHLFSSSLLLSFHPIWSSFSFFSPLSSHSSHSFLLL